MLLSTRSSLDLIIRDSTTQRASRASFQSVDSAVMSRPAVASNAHRGRYAAPVPTTNLLSDENDFPEFEPFDDVPGPRTAPAGGAQVSSVDMCLQINKQNHMTTAYDMEKLVIRRGKAFLVRVCFSRRVEADEFQLEFLIGADPSVNRGSLVIVTFGNRQGSAWSGRVVEWQGECVTLEITPTADAIVGKYRFYVAIETSRGMQRTKRDANTDLYLLFNAWCEADTVFVNNEAARQEYVMADYGAIFQGSVGSVSSRKWMFGQFERGVLDACIYILDASQMPIYNRGNVVKLIRKGSAMFNSQDDRGVLVGNWSDDYSMGTSPTAWTGSIKILLQYANTGVPVCFAQCWVFAGVFNTFLRCLGIPARVITNFNSAHDNTGNLKTDLIFKMDGTPDDRYTKDSIWNYHCWNEVFITRPDLPPGLSGWQVVDATPQETSDGHYRCGPASVNAIKEGLLCHPFDSGFVFAEVNSDIVSSKRDRYGNLKPFSVDKTHVGKLILTQAVGSMSMENITETYKHPEGSSHNETTMERAEEYGCARDHSELPEPQLTVSIRVNQAQVGEEVKVEVIFHNPGSEPRQVRAHLAGSIAFYTGVESQAFKHVDFSANVDSQSTEQVDFVVSPHEYMAYLGFQTCLHFAVTGQAEDQSLSAMEVVDLQTLPLTLTVGGPSVVYQEMSVTVSYTNMYDVELSHVFLALEGPGVVEFRSHYYSSIKPGATISWTEHCVPRLYGRRCIFAVMYCLNFPQMYGYLEFQVSY
ncbi:uncharacterized protein V6R79_018316 [Siganus canaliculatus]